MIDAGPDTPIVPAPDWVLRLWQSSSPHPSQSPCRPPSPRHSGHSKYGAAALERTLGKVVMSITGQRNHVLNKASFTLGQLVGGGELSAPEVVSSLLIAAEQIGLPEHEARRTVESGLRAGFASPRSAPK